MKTVKELALEYAHKVHGFWDGESLDHHMVVIKEMAFLAGYKAAEQNGVRSNYDDHKFKDNVRATYNDHKLKEAEETIAKLKERLKLLSLEFSRIMETTEEVRDLFEYWKKDDLQFEHHGKVGPWAGFFPVNKDK
jgi:hypothetical protein